METQAVFQIGQIGFVVLFCAYFVIREWRERNLCSNLVLQGKEMQATVVAVKLLWYLNYRPRVIDYTYSVNGSSFTQRNRITKDKYNSLRSVRTVEIRYLPDDPSISRIVEVLEAKTGVMLRKAQSQDDG